MGPPEGPPAGLCVIRVTCLSQEKMLITVTTTRDVVTGHGTSSVRLIDVSKATELVARFLQDWQLRTNRFEESGSRSETSERDPR